MRYFFSQNGVDYIGDEKLDSLFRAMSISYVPSSPKDIESFNFIVNSDSFLFLQLGVTDAEVLHFRQKSTTTVMYLSSVMFTEYNQNLIIIVTNMWYTQSGGFVMSVLCVERSIVDSMIRKFHIDEFFKNN